ncbi:hypothetical protein L596_011472 [Steinernema carpocapsae]|nr:hypothetical protein L596_011472 [Steinernema carpocapsae]
MKSVKPSQELTRRNSFKKEGRDVKFFEKVVLPLMHAYFNAHKSYFLASSSIVQTGMASNKEKEMVANLFCRLAALLRIKNHAFGSVAKITVKCLQGLTQALDLRTLVKANSDIVRTSLLTFFNNCADDLFTAVQELKECGQYALLRGENLKSWLSVEFANQMIIPVLTTMFSHLARNHFGTDLLLDDIQAACYKILDSLYMVTELSAAVTNRKSIAYEIEKCCKVVDLGYRIVPEYRFASLELGTVPKRFRELLSDCLLGAGVQQEQQILGTGEDAGSIGPSPGDASEALHAHPSA